MCVAVPGRITWIGAATAASIPAQIETGGATHDVDLVMVRAVRNPYFRQVVDRTRTPIYAA